MSIVMKLVYTDSHLHDPLGRARLSNIIKSHTHTHTRALDGTRRTKRHRVAAAAAAAAIEVSLAHALGFREQVNSRNESKRASSRVSISTQHQQQHNSTPKCVCVLSKKTLFADCMVTLTWYQYCTHLHTGCVGCAPSCCVHHTHTRHSCTNTTCPLPPALPPPSNPKHRINTRNALFYFNLIVKSVNFATTAARGNSDQRQQQQAHIV